MFLALLVRCKEEPYVREFVDYYLSQGVDTLYILDDGSSPEIYSDVLDYPQVKITYDHDIIQKNSIKTLYESIKNEYEWVIYVDMDEYITTKKHKEKTIRQELETTFRECECIKIPWVMMSCNGVEKNPVSLLHTNVFRWNHDKAHVNQLTNEHKFRCRYKRIEVKCIFKPRYFHDIFDHHPRSPSSAHNVRIVDGVYNKPHPLSPFYSQLREKDIGEGYLLCYHYRIVSIENCRQKIANNEWYKKYTLEDLLSTDYAEVVDTTLREKMVIRDD